MQERERCRKELEKRLNAGDVMIPSDAAAVNAAVFVL